jgi:predicted GNAT family acetyltransferase
MPMTLYVLDGEPASPRSVPAAPGRYRLATSKDTSLLAPWSVQFADEVGIEQPENPVAFVEGRIAKKQLVLWEHEAEVVSLAGWSGMTEHGVRLNQVYTPEALRGRGYAEACVGELSRRLIRSGRSFCLLYADKNNPSSNRLYQKLDYEPRGESLSIKFF